MTSIEERSVGYRFRQSVLGFFDKRQGTSLLLLKILLVLVCGGAITGIETLLRTYFTAHPETLTSVTSIVLNSGAIAFATSLVLYFVAWAGRRLRVPKHVSNIPERAGTYILKALAAALIAMTIIVFFTISFNFLMLIFYSFYKLIIFIGATLFEAALSSFSN